MLVMFTIHTIGLYVMPNERFPFISQKRLQKELLALQNDPPPGMTLNEKSVQNTITQ